MNIQFGSFSLSLIVNQIYKFQLQFTWLAVPNRLQFIYAHKLHNVMGKSIWRAYASLAIWICSSAHIELINHIQTQPN